MSSLNPQALNRYAYVLNRPLNFIDPTGHIALIDGYAPVSSATNVIEKKIATQKTNQIILSKPMLAASEPQAAEQAQKAANLAQKAQIAENYSISVSIDRGISTRQEKIALDRIERAASTADIATGSLGGFEATFATHSSTTGTVPISIFVRNAANIQEDPTYFGINHGFVDGAFRIELALSPLLGYGSNKGSKLVMHEIAHNITSQGFDFISYAGGGPYGTAARSYEDLGVNAGSYAYDQDAKRDLNHPLNIQYENDNDPDTSSLYNPNWRYELTADYLASTLLGTFRNNGIAYALAVNQYLACWSEDTCD